MATTKKAAASKELTIVAIYKFKTDGKLNGTRCYLVRNIEGHEYKVWTHHNDNLTNHCECDGFEKSHGRRKCYHLKHVEAREAACKCPGYVAETSSDLVERAKARAATASADNTLLPGAQSQPVNKRKVCPIEENLPTWLKIATYGHSRNGYLSGRTA